jgi:hypothetical protein
MFEKIPPGKPKQSRFTKAQQKAMAEAVPVEEEAEGLFVSLSFKIVFPSSR